MFADGCIFPFSAAWVVGRYAEWPIPGVTDTRGWTELYSGKSGMVRAGGSASRIIGDRSATDPGGDMLFVVANIGPDGLLGTEALQ